MKKVIVIVLIFAILLPEFLSAQIYNNAYLTIKVNVSNVKIRINNAYYGYASPDEPIIEELNAGNYTIKAFKDGYKEETKVINLKPGDSSEIIFKLQRPEDFEVDKDKEEGIIGVEYGSMTVVVKMKGELVPAKVYIDNKFADNATVSVKKLFSGVHEVRVEYKGYKKEEKVTIQKDSRKIVEIELFSTSNISIESKTKDTTLKINNKKYNIFTNLKLEKETYNFKFSKYGYISAEKNVYINGENNYRIIVKLSKDLPYVTAKSLGRHIKYINDINFKKRSENYASYYGIYGFVAGMLIGIPVANSVYGNPDKIGGEKGNTGGSIITWLFFMGGGYLIGWLIGKNKINRDNVNYNIRTYNQLKNRVIEYNTETEKLIKQEQTKIYLEKVIQVYEY